MANIINDYEVFTNDQNALAFFMARSPVIDQMDANGPFQFHIDGDTLMAGNEVFKVAFPEMEPGLIDIAKARGVIMLVEFENQQAARCTPCYLSH